MIRRLGLISFVSAAVLAVPTTALAHGHDDAPLPPSSAFQKVTLDDFPGEPIALAVLPDRRVLHTARTGEVRIHEPSTGRNVLAATIPVYQHDEEGVQGIAIDPDFKHNNWVYVYYSPPLNTPADDPNTPTFNEGDAPSEGTAADFAPYKGFLRLSRFKLAGNTLQLNTEQKIIEVATDRGQCCHVGGKIDFDRSGNLFLSTGDDTNPFFSDGYAPIDERADRNPVFDAQRSAGNTNDLRGKLLRIKVGKSGGYTMPKGNLFRPGTPKTRPEIYAMGLRNPFRFTVDPNSDTVYMADYSPDANEPNPARGPAGHGRWMAIDKPANYGWPYCVAPDMPYVDYDFATGASRRWRRPRSSTHTARARNSPNWAPAASARWVDRRTTTTSTSSRRPSGRRRSTRSHCSVSGPGTTSRRSRWTATTRSSGLTPYCRKLSLIIRWTWSSARTARSTFSSTATGTSRRTRTRSWPASTTRPATARRS
jgi:glucose/arabinose dehydrogenase